MVLTYDNSQIIKNTTDNLFNNSYLNMKKIINDVIRFIYKKDRIFLSESSVIILLKHYKNNLLISYYNDSNYNDSYIKDYFYDLKNKSIIYETDNINEYSYYLALGLKINSKEEFMTFKNDIYNLYIKNKNKLVTEQESPLLKEIKSLKNDLELKIKEISDFTITL